MERPLKTRSILKRDGDKFLSKKSANSTDKASSVIWLKNLRKVAEGVRGIQKRTPEGGIKETVLLMVMAYNRLNEEFGTQGLKERVRSLQSAGNAFLSKADERRRSL